MRKSREQLLDDLGDLGRRLAGRRLTEAREAWADVELALASGARPGDSDAVRGGPPPATAAPGDPAPAPLAPVLTPPLPTDPAPAAETARLRRMIELAPVGIALIDPSGCILECNRAVQQLWQHSRDELRGRSIAHFAHAEDGADILADLRTMTEVPEIRRSERRYYRKDGSSIWVSLVIAPIPDSDGRPPGCIAILDDVTGRRRSEDALREDNQQLAGWVTDLEHRTQEISLLSEMGDLLQACRSPDEAYAVIARMARPMFPTSSGSVHVISSSLAEAVATWGAAVGERLFGPDECWALRRGRVHLVQDQELGLTCKHMHQPQSGASICVPMVAHGEALGLLTLSSPEAEHLPEAKQRLASTVAEHIALALANLRLHERLRSQSIRDPLTNLYNRRYMEESLDREMRRAARGRYPVGIIMLDLDHFKRFNDAFGHDAGDALLREVGGVLQRSIRGEDIACRRSGEEFALILPEASLADASRRAEQLREAIRGLSIEYRRQPLGSITVSLGVAIFPAHGPTAEAVLRAADTALYQAKEWGRDRVAVNPGNTDPIESRGAS